MCAGALPSILHSEPLWLSWSASWKPNSRMLLLLLLHLLNPAADGQTQGDNIPGSLSWHCCLCNTENLIKYPPPSVLNERLISSLPGCRYAWWPPNGCCGRPGSSHLLLPVGILSKTEKDGVFMQPKNTQWKKYAANKNRHKSLNPHPVKTCGHPQYGNTHLIKNSLIMDDSCFLAPTHV